MSEKLKEMTKEEKETIVEKIDFLCEEVAETDCNKCILKDYRCDCSEITDDEFREMSNKIDEYNRLRESNIENNSDDKSYKHINISINLKVLESCSDMELVEILSDIKHSLKEQYNSDALAWNHGMITDSDGTYNML